MEFGVTYRQVPDWIVLATTPSALKLWCVMAQFADCEGRAWPSTLTLGAFRFVSYHGYQLPQGARKDGGYRDRASA